MLSGLLLLALAAPFTPTLEDPAPEGWTIGRFAEFSTSSYEDDAGVPAQSVRLEFRRDDAGYGLMDETIPYNRTVNTDQVFPVEGTRLCWRARHQNVFGALSDPSA